MVAPDPDALLSQEFGGDLTAETGTLDVHETFVWKQREKCPAEDRKTTKMCVFMLKPDIRRCRVETSLSVRRFFFAKVHNRTKGEREPACQ